jgi:hypothetical protein
MAEVSTSNTAQVILGGGGSTIALTYPNGVQAIQVFSGGTFAFFPDGSTNAWSIEPAGTKFKILQTFVFTNSTMEDFGGNLIIDMSVPSIGGGVYSGDFAGVNLSSGAYAVNGLPVVGTRKAAIPDTSGATLAQLEAEVNKLKAMLRSTGGGHGLMT